MPARRLARLGAAPDFHHGLLETIGPETQPNLFPTREDRFAYYLNGYNALVFKGVLSRGPEQKSLWRGLISRLRFFVMMKVQIDGQRMNLKNLEDRLIREQFKDPRIHAALNCASISCPRLPRHAFAPASLSEQLDAAMAEFVGEARNCTADEGVKTVTLPKIFDWFRGDFLDFERSQGNADPNLIDYVNRYRPGNAQIPREYAIKFFKYDKVINSRP